MESEIIRLARRSKLDIVRVDPGSGTIEVTLVELVAERGLRKAYA
jgi:hypothetical protein